MRPRMFAPGFQDRWGHAEQRMCRLWWRGGRVGRLGWVGTQLGTASEPSGEYCPPDRLNVTFISLWGGKVSQQQNERYGTAHVL